ncbi:MAG: glutathione S-transferase family protein [Pseudomonadota bacterium]
MISAEDDLVFYSNPQSRGQIVRWMLEEIGAPYRTEILDYASTMKEPAYLAINPMGKVPAITHRGAVITEGAAICAYLADAFPQAGLAPAPGDPARGAYYRWLFFAAGPLEAATSNAAFKFQAPAEGARSLGYGTLEATLDTVESALRGRSHIAGDVFSAADLYLSAYLGFLMSFKMIEKRQAFADYVSVHASRPAAVRAKEIDAALVGA